ncbi:MAG TPA: hypothetical protein P5096_01090 [Patescibacteria group bacterium]|nr:hypothetical protein [Patescibacteria group bacterium]
MNFQKKGGKNKRVFLILTVLFVLSFFISLIIPLKASAAELAPISLNDPGTLEYYSGYGINDVTDDNLTAVNTAIIAAQDVKKANLTTDEAQNVVDEIIKSSEESVPPISVNDNPGTLEYYENNGITGVTEENLRAVNTAVIAAQDVKKSNLTKAEVQAAAKTAAVKGGSSSSSGDASKCPDDVSGMDFMGLMKDFKQLPKNMFCKFFDIFLFPPRLLVNNFLTTDRMSNSLTLPTNIAAGNFVIEMWTIIRNIINVLFMLAFMIMALLNVLNTLGLGSVLGQKLESWQVKKMIPAMIGAVVLVNFSLSICNLFVDASNYLVGLFLQSSGSGGIAEGIDPIFNGGFSAFMVLDGVALAAVVVKVIAIWAFTIVLLYTWMILWVRKIIVQLLFIFSATPYIANVIPFKQVTDLVGKWTGYFVQWVFMGPLVALFLYISAKAISITGDVVPTIDLGIDPNGIEKGNYNLTQLILAIIVIYIGITMTMKMSKEAATVVDKGISAATGGKVKGMGDVQKWAGSQVKRGSETRLKEAAKRTDEDNKTMRQKIGSGYARAVLGAKEIPKRYEEPRAARAKAAEMDWDKYKQNNLTGPAFNDKMFAEAKNRGNYQPRALSNAILDPKLTKIEHAASLKVLQDKAKGIGVMSDQEQMTAIKELEKLRGQGIDPEGKLPIWSNFKNYRELTGKKPTVDNYFKDEAAIMSLSENPDIIKELDLNKFSQENKNAVSKVLEGKRNEMKAKMKEVGNLGALEDDDLTDLLNKIEKNEDIKSYFGNNETDAKNFRQKLAITDEAISHGKIMGLERKLTGAIKNSNVQRMRAEINDPSLMMAYGGDEEKYYEYLESFANSIEGASPEKAFELGKQFYPDIALVDKTKPEEIKASGERMKLYANEMKEVLNWRRPDSQGGSESDRKKFKYALKKKSSNL